MKKELIVARYQENIDWIKEVDQSVESIRVYNKGGDVSVEESRAVITELPNVGREAHTYVHHFLHNREKLADYTLTCQGDPFEHSPDIMGRFAINYRGLKSLSVRYMEEWPPKKVTDTDLSEKYKGFEIRLGDMDTFGHRNRVTTRKWFEHIWAMVFKDPCPEKYYFGYSAMWAIPKKLITYRNVGFWEYIYDLLRHQYSTEVYSCSIDAWALEALWHAILTPTNRTRI